MAIVLALGFFIAPVIGLRRALKRMKTKQRSTGAVVLASAGMAFSAIAGLSERLNWFFRLLAIVLNGAWRWSAISANRSASRDAALRTVMK